VIFFLGEVEGAVRNLKFFRSIFDLRRAIILFTLKFKIEEMYYVYYVLRIMTMIFMLASTIESIALHCRNALLVGLHK
jgi:hypothetical protein